MFLAVGLPVEELSRRRYGPLTDKGLEPGGFRELSGEEVEALRRAGEEVAGEVAKEVEGSPVMLAAEAPPEPDAEAQAAAAELPSMQSDTPMGASGEPDAPPPDDE